MKVTIPGDASDFTLGQIQEWLKGEQTPERAVRMFAKGKFENIPESAIDQLGIEIIKAINSDKGRFTPVFRIGRKLYGFHPDIQSITTGEIADIDTYSEDYVQNLHKTLAVLCRPISRYWLGKYRIKSYDGDKPSFEKRAEEMKKLGWDKVIGIGFFLETLERDCLTNLAKFSVQEIQKELHLVVSGGGTEH